MRASKPQDDWAMHDRVAAKLTELLTAHKRQLLECLASEDVCAVLSTSIIEATGEMVELGLKNAWLKRQLFEKTCLALSS
jgi:hypothetical protein